MRCVVQFHIISESFHAFDGKLILTSEIMKPNNTDSVSESYIDRYSSACIDFVKLKLLPQAVRKYSEEVARVGAFAPFRYFFNVKATLEDEDISSFVMYSLLYRSTDLLAYGLRTVTFNGDFVVMRTAKQRRASLVLGEGRTHFLAKIEKGILILTPI